MVPVTITLLSIPAVAYLNSDKATKTDSNFISAVQNFLEVVLLVELILVDCSSALICNLGKGGRVINLGDQ